VIDRLTLTCSGLADSHTFLSPRIANDSLKLCNCHFECLMLLILFKCILCSLVRFLIEQAAGLFFMYRLHNKVLMWVFLKSARVELNLEFINSRVNCYDEEFIDTSMNCVSSKRFLIPTSLVFCLSDQREQSSCWGVLLLFPGYLCCKMTHPV